VSNDAARHELAEVLALAQEQMADLAAVHKKRATLTANATVADGTVEVTVNAQGIVTRTVIDETYQDEFDFADLGDYITAAAQAAAREVGKRSAELLAPMTERRKQFPGLSDIVEGAPDFRDWMPDLTALRPEPASTVDTDEGDDDGSFTTTVRR
jgi:DNA-binding protein YbaB